MHTKLTIFLSILLFLGSCQAHMPLTTPESSSVEGQINLYFSTKSLSPPNITFTLKKIEVEERENEEWFTLFEGKKEINSIDLISRQIFLSESYLPVGKYVRMKATITEASVTRGEKQFSLALPPNDGAVILPVRFQIFKRESSALFLNWNPENSIVDTYLFQPTFILNPQKIGIKELLLYVTNRGSDNVTVINRKSDQVVGTIGVDKDPMGIVSSPSGNEIYIANADSNTISIIDTSHHKVVDTISLNFGISPRELAVSPDGQRLFVSNFHSNNVSIIDTIGKNLLGQATVGNNPLGIAVNVRGDRIYVV
ncbi:MAG: beta-propeller fold lactonase family protein, partial [Thermodesulfobacteriota bacterium]|nr:beta-propeller fold lactonase family protein [Thermodesulfobacteriota bacterium]